MVRCLSKRLWRHRYLPRSQTRLDQAIAPDAVINPEGLPVCGQLAAGPCQGDGTTLKELLEALLTVGEVTVSAISNGIEAAGDDAEVCGVDGVSLFGRVCVFRRVLQLIGKFTVRLEHLASYGYRR